MNESTQQMLPLDGRPLPEPAASIWRVLERFARGRGNAIPMRDLAAHCGLSTRQVQGEIELLIREYSKPIGSSCGKLHGYYVIEDQADLEETHTNLRNRGIANLIRANKLKYSPEVAAALGQLKIG